MTQKPWTSKETEEMMELASRMSLEDTAKILQRSVMSVRNRRRDVMAKMHLPLGPSRKNRKCSVCGEVGKASWVECHKCGLELHTVKDCARCGEWNAIRGRCEAFLDEEDPILGEDGKCIGWKEKGWEDIVW